MNDIEIIAQSRLFNGLKSDYIESLTRKYGKFIEIQSGEPLFEHIKGNCAVILSGLAVILSVKGNDRCILRFASCSDTVGLASLFTTNEFNTSVEASGKEPLRAYVLSTADITEIMDSQSGSILRDNMLSFLCDKAAFLSSRLNCVTQGSSETKLASYIMYSARDKDMFDPGISMVNLSKILNVGRTSLYRAMDSLCEKGLIEYNKTVFKIPDKEKLLSFIMEGV